MPRTISTVPTATRTVRISTPRRKNGVKRSTKIGVDDASGMTTLTAPKPRATMMRKTPAFSVMPAARQHQGAECDHRRRHIDRSPEDRAHLAQAYFPDDRDDPEAGGGGEGQHDLPRAEAETLPARREQDGPHHDDDGADEKPYRFIRPLRSQQFDILVREHYADSRDYLGVFSAYP